MFVLLILGTIEMKLLLRYLILVESHSLTKTKLNCTRNAAPQQKCHFRAGEGARYEFLPVPGLGLPRAMEKFRTFPKVLLGKSKIHCFRLFFQRIT